MRDDEEEGTNDESRGQSEKKSRAEEEAKGVERYFDDWEQMAKMIKESAEDKTAERSAPGAGMGVDAG